MENTISQVMQTAQDRASRIIGFLRVNSEKICTSEAITFVQALAHYIKGTSFASVRTSIFIESDQAAQAKHNCINYAYCKPDDISHYLLDPTFNAEIWLCIGGSSFLKEAYAIIREAHPQHTYFDSISWRLGKLFPAEITWFDPSKREVGQRNLWALLNFFFTYLKDLHIKDMHELSTHYMSTLLPRLKIDD